MKKIAFFDIDGTLIDASNHLLEPTAQVKEALKAFQKKGNLIFIASARGSLPFKEEDLKFDGFIGNDGHYITYQDDIILDDQFTKEEVKEIEEVLKANDGRYMFAGHVYWWSRYWLDEYMQEHARIFRSSTKKPDNLIESYESINVEALSCCAMFKNKEDLYLAYNQLKDRYTMILYDTGLIRMDIYRKGFKKGSAVKFIYEKLGIPQENTYAFGDGINDMEMFSCVGHPIAMENAVDELKNIAEEITKSVLDDGIAYYLNKIED